jgi:rhamnose utilization protein RhaD (predicted bifunctional aldolase and dehydrogenase)
MNSNGDGETVDDVASLREELARLSRAFGSDPEYVRAGGGNSSVKARGILYVKPSGTPLAEATAEGMVALRLETLRQLAIAGAGGDSPLETDGFGEAVRAARTDPDEARRPSVEAALHALLPRRFVVHTHPPMANALTCSTSGSTICRELFGDDVLWVPYADPGSRLAAAVARALRGYTEHTGRDCPRGLLLQNHGIFIGGETAEEVRDTTSWIMSALRHQVGTPDLLSGADSTGGLEPGEVRRLINTLSPVLRGLLATSARLKVVTFSGGDNARALAGSAIGRELVSGGPVTPDQIVYSGSFPLWLDLPDGVSTAEILDHVGSSSWSRVSACSPLVMTTCRRTPRARCTRMRSAP